MENLLNLTSFLEDGNDMNMNSVTEDGRFEFDDGNVTSIPEVVRGGNFSRRLIIDIGIELRITFHALIFILAVTGNSLVITVLAKNKRMRTVTNVFLLNLAISDLLLAVFCIPFTLIPVILRNFIFGPVMCVLVRYLQATIVAVNSFTLLALSLERYFAICHPLRSRRWQTLSHAYKIILGGWLSALFFTLPVAIFQRLRTMRNGNKLCIEIWPDKTLGKVYQIFLDIILFLLPLMMMMVAYSLIAKTLSVNFDKDLALPTQQGNKSKSKARNEPSQRKQDSSSTTELTNASSNSINDSYSSENRTHHSTSRSVSFQTTESLSIQQVQHERSLQNKKRVIKMLFVVVLEFFICWTPLFTIMTWEYLDRRTLSRHLSGMAKSYIQLLAYTSSCCNPITYCFMNSRFRQSFISAFQCRYIRVHNYKARTAMGLDVSTTC
nr:cholecystokinin receptor type A [Octopus vulgaris]